MNKNSRLIRRLFIYLVAITAAIVVIGIIRFTAPEMLQEILLDADASFWPFTVQNVMWVSLFVGFGELFLRWSAASDEESQLRRGYLPTKGEPLSDEILFRDNLGGPGHECCFGPATITCASQRRTRT